MKEALLILGMTLVTFGVRYPILALFGRISLPKGLLRALAYVPPSILAAIIVPALLSPASQARALQFGQPRLLAGLSAMVVGWWTKNLLATIIFGMLSLWFWGWILTVCP